MTAKSTKSRSKPANRIFRKSTVLDGYYASGDWDSFCFDRCPHPSIHGERKRGGQGVASEEDYCVYPEDLLPMDPNRGKWAKRSPYGRWHITVEFEPRQRPAKDRKALDEMMRRQHAAVRAAQAKRRKEGL